MHSSEHLDNRFDLEYHVENCHKRPRPEGQCHIREVFSEVGFTEGLWGVMEGVKGLI